ncbi:MAG: hypothetical protein IKN55_04910, partial [Oscillospiraceae bacterium]|nr:hypothetical protein [Oscillospiraceae bacterium]
NTEDDIFTLDPEIGACEIVLDNADELPFTVDYEAEISNNYIYNSYMPPINRASVKASITLPPEMEAGDYRVNFRVTKLTDTEGNDLLQYADEDTRILSAWVYYRPETVTPTEPTEPTEPADQPFDPTMIEGLGNLNEDDAVNASDAALMLIEAATIGAGREGTFTEEQNTRADVNGDKTVNASDAALTLQYAASVGTGNTQSFGEYLKSTKGL